MTVHVKNIPYAAFRRLALAHNACTPALRWLADGEKDLRTALAELTNAQWVYWFAEEMLPVLNLPYEVQREIDAALKAVDARYEIAQEAYNTATATITQRAEEDRRPLQEAARAKLKAIREAHDVDRKGGLLYGSPEWLEVQHESAIVYAERNAAVEEIDQWEVLACGPFERTRKETIDKIDADIVAYVKALIVVDD